VPGDVRLDASEERLLERASKKWGRAEILGLVAVVTVAAGHLVLGLGSYGLWDPPDDWKASIQRRPLQQEGKKTKKRTKPYGVAISEIAIAEHAREGFSEKQGGEGDGSKRSGAGSAVSKKRDRSRHQREEAALQEPPLRMWLIRQGLEAFGVSDWAARLPIALCGVLTVLLVYLVGAWFFGWVGGMLAAGALLGFPGFVLQARLLTSHLPATTCLTMAVAGLALQGYPGQKGWLRALGLLLGAAGLTTGYFAAGAVLGALTPLLIALVATGAWFWVRRGQLEPSRRKQAWIEIALFAAAVAVLTIWTQTELAAADGYTSFLGAEPRYAVKMLSYEGVKTPPARPVVFDVLIRHIAYSTFPWVALIPLALAVCAGLGRRAPQIGEAAGPHASSASRRFSYGGVWVASWAAVSFLMSTYWVLRFDNMPFLGLPALGLACGGAVAALIRKDEPRRTGAAILSVLLVAIVIRDFVDFPQALAQSQVNYQLHHPEEVALRGPMAVFGLLFAGAALILLITRPCREEVRWPETLEEWLVARHESSQLSKLFQWRWLHGFRAPLGWPAAVVVATVLLVVAWIKLAAYGVLEAFYFPFWLVGQAESGAALRPAKLLFPGNERGHLSKLVRRSRRGAPPSQVFWTVVGVFVAPLWAFRFAARIFWLVTVGLFAFGLKRVGAAIGGRLKAWREAERRLIEEKRRERDGQAGDDEKNKERKKEKKREKTHEPAGNETKRNRNPSGGGPEVAGTRLWAGALICVVGLAASYWVGHVLLDDLSVHFSHKSIFETFKQSRAKLDGDSPLALYKMESRSASFYNAGDMITERELQRRHPYGRDRLDPLVAYLAGQDRVFALIGVSHLGSLDNQARKAGVDYYVLDASSQWFLLVSNQLAPGEADKNPLKRYVSQKPPEQVGRRINAVLKEPGSKNEAGDLVLLGAEIPKVVYKGHKFPAKLHFYVKNDLKRDWKVFIHFDGPGPRFFGDHEPLGGRYKTRFWTAGTYVTDPYVVPANHTSRISTPSGVYRIWMGLYRGGTRMSVIQGPASKNNRINLGTVRVTSKPLFSCSPR
jgi:hypothetical protein